MQNVTVELPQRVLADAAGWRLLKWLVKKGATVHRNQRVAVLKSLSSAAVEDVLAPHSGTLTAVAVSEGTIVQLSNQPIAQIQFCPHSVVFKGVCAVCGQEAEPPHFAESTRQRESRLPVAYNATSLSVTRAEAQSVSFTTAKRLFESNRLSLVLDLDHTLVHASDDFRAPEVLRHAPAASNTSSVSSFDLTVSSRRSSRMYVKLRPNLAEFLERVAARFELHIYTMGTGAYADKVANLMDPDKRFFSGRITSREDFVEGNWNQKNIQRLFPCDDSMVLIVDDREDVWISGGQTYMPNLIGARPYKFWDGLNEAYDRNLPSNPSPQLSQPVGRVTMSKSAVEANGDGKAPKKSTVLPKPETTSCARSNAGNAINVGCAETEKGGKDAAISASKEDSEIIQTKETSGIVEQPGSAVKGKQSELNQTAGGDATSPNNLGNSKQATRDLNENDPKSNHAAEQCSSDTPMKDVAHYVTNETALTEMEIRGRRVREAERRRWLTDEAPKAKNHLLRLADVLEQCHTEFFRQAKRKELSERASGGTINGPFKVPVDVKDILAGIRRKVLAECVITFTGIIAHGFDPAKNRSWNLALRLGAICSMDFVNGRTTHVVASEARGLHTQKCKEAMFYGTAFVVSTRWLEDSALNFERQEEYPYCDGASSGFASAVEFKAFVEKRHAEAARVFKKRKLGDLEGVWGSEVSLPPRKKVEREPSSGTTGPVAQPSNDGARILSEEELGAAMEAAFDD